MLNYLKTKLLNSSENNDIDRKRSMKRSSWTASIDKGTESGYSSRSSSDSNKSSLKRQTMGPGPDKNHPNGGFDTSLREIVDSNIAAPMDVKKEKDELCVVAVTSFETQSAITNNVDTSSSAEKCITAAVKNEFIVSTKRVRRQSVFFEPMTRIPTHFDASKKMLNVDSKLNTASNGCEPKDPVTALTQKKKRRQTIHIDRLPASGSFKPNDSNKKGGKPRPKPVSRIRISSTDELTIDKKATTIVTESTGSAKKLVGRPKKSLSTFPDNQVKAEHESSKPSSCADKKFETIQKKQSVAAKTTELSEKSSNEEPVILGSNCETTSTKLIDSPAGHSKSTSLLVEIPKKKTAAKSPKPDKKIDEPPPKKSKTIKEQMVVDEIIEDIWDVTLKAKLGDWFPQFLVKWDGFPMSENTYEPYEHVSHADCLKDYVSRKFELHHDRIETAIEKLYEEAHSVREHHSSKPMSFIQGKLLKFDLFRFKCNVLAYIYTYEKVANTCNFMRVLRHQTVIYKFYLKSEEWKATNEKLMNKIMKKEKRQFRVTAENMIDFDQVPTFKYLKKVNNPLKSPLQGFGCKCIFGCQKVDCTCPSTKDVEFVYDIDGRISALSHQMIVECNSLCMCDESCNNRRKSTKISLCIFKTSNRGWSLKTLDPIPQGTFVIEYTGELIDQTEAQKRWSQYKKNGNNYLFDLDYNEESEAVYSIDATNEGNLSRFINHSCSANLQTWPATSCNENPKMHRLYYFSLRQIRPGEELTVDYSGGVHVQSERTPPKDSEVCRCGAMNCKGFIF